jgi:hypothetical protein
MGRPSCSSFPSMFRSLVRVASGAGLLPHSAFVSLCALCGFVVPSLAVGFPSNSARCPPNPQIPQMNTDRVRNTGSRRRFSHGEDRGSSPDVANALESGWPSRYLHQSATSADQGLDRAPCALGGGVSAPSSATLPVQAGCWAGPPAPRSAKREQGADRLSEAVCRSPRSSSQAKPL